MIRGVLSELKSLGKSEETPVVQTEAANDIAGGRSWKNAGRFGGD